MDDNEKIVDAINDLNNNFTKLMKKNFSKSFTSKERFESQKDRSQQSGTSQRTYQQIKDRQERTALMFEKHAHGLAGSLKLLHGSTNDAVSGFKNLADKLAGGALGGVIIGGLTEWIGHLTKTYRDMSDIGQTFAGGLIDMSKAAASSGVSLEEYSRMIAKNSTIAAQIGGKQFGQIAMDVRNKTDSLGLSIEETNDMVGDYMQAMRLAGKDLSKSSAEATLNISDMADEATKVSSVFGTSRKEILKTTMELKKDVLYAATAGTLPTNVQKGYDNTLTAFAGNTDDGFMARFFAHMVGAGGNAYQTDEGKMFGNVGLGNVGTYMAQRTQQAQNLNPEQAMYFANDTNKQVKKQIEGILPTLQIQARNGNGDALQILGLYEKLRVATDEEIRQKIKDNSENKKGADVLLKFQNTWSLLTSKLQLGLYTAITPVFNAFGNFLVEFEKKGGFEAIGKLATQFGDWLGSILGGTPTGDKKDDTTAPLNDRVQNFIKALGDNNSGLIGSIVSLAMGPLSGLTKTVAEVVGGFYLFKTVLKTLVGSFTAVMNVRAGVVNVSGGMGGMGGLGGGPGLGGKMGGFGRLLGGAMMGLGGVESLMQAKDDQPGWQRYLDAGLGGAGVGGAVGSVIPGFGTMVGAAAGGIAGVGSIALTDLVDYFKGKKEEEKTPKTDTPSLISEAETATISLLKDIYGVLTQTHQVNKQILNNQ